MTAPISESMDQILDRFDDAWNGPTPPRIEDYLAKAAPDHRLPLLIELVRIDLERRLAAGEKVRLEEIYLPRFPQLFAELPALVTLVKHEYIIRRRNEPDLLPVEYVERFPQCLTELVIQLPTLDEISNGERQSKTANAPAGLDLRGYELTEPLGKGGMGEVYRCVDPALGCDLAIKVMMTAHRGHPECERRFLREARITGLLQHPGIVPIHNLGRLSDGRLHYTMRLVRGSTFADILKDEAGKPERLPYLLTIFEKICQAVAYAHSKRVIHRDLKPQNVMVGKYGEVQVMDWGLAKVLTLADTPTEPEKKTGTPGTSFVAEADTPVDRTRTGSVMGTPSYMPPEQALGEWDAMDERTDVFGLGSILCEILTGQPVYVGTNVSELCDRAERGDVMEALQHLQQCRADAALTVLCRECLSPHREDRPRDADAVAKRVAEYQAEIQERLRQAELDRLAVEALAREEQGRTLVEQERKREALARVKLAGSYVKIGNLSRHRDQLKEALDWYSKAIPLLESILAQDDRMATARRYLSDAYNNLGATLSDQGKHGEAELACCKAIALKPDLAEAYRNLGAALYGQAKLGKAETAYRKAIALKLDFALAYHDLGVVLNSQGKRKEAEEACRMAIALKPDFAKAYATLGNILRGQGRFAESLTAYRVAHNVGSKHTDWHYPSLRWVREAEQLIELETKLPAILKGDASPANPGEAISLAQMCLQYKKQPAAASRLYFHAFTADRKIAADLNEKHRYRAARSAALAAAGQHEDALVLSDKKATMFRDWALGWLRDVLTAYTKLAEHNNPKAHKMILQCLRNWRCNPDLASVRDPQALDRLPVIERAAWQSLWRDVDELAKRVAKPDETKAAQKKPKP